MCTTKLDVRGTKGTAQRTLSVCEILLDDPDKMIVKAMSWALRALSKCDPERTADFIAQHRSRLHSLVVREVTIKLQTGLKSPRPARSSKVRMR